MHTSKAMPKQQEDEEKKPIMQVPNMNTSKAMPKKNCNDNEKLKLIKMILDLEIC